MNRVASARCGACGQSFATVAEWKEHAATCKVRGMAMALIQLAKYTDVSIRTREQEIELLQEAILRAEIGMSRHRITICEMRMKQRRRRVELAKQIEIQARATAEKGQAGI